MRRAVTARRALLVLATLLLLVLAWGALAGAVRQLPRAVTFGQQLQTAVQLACGVLTLLLVPASFVLRRWTPTIRAAWLAGLVAAAGLSGLVWGPPMPLIALAFALLAYAAGRLVLRGLQRLTDGSVAGAATSRPLRGDVH
jgi:hypothetical protein